MKQLELALADRQQSVDLGPSRLKRRSPQRRTLRSIMVKLQGVFKLNTKNASNLNQMIEAIGRDGYMIAQSYVHAAAKGDICFP